MKQLVPPSQGADHVIIIGVLSIPTIYEAVLQMIQESYFGGVMIDTRTTPATISKQQSYTSWFY